MKPKVFNFTSDPGNLEPFRNDLARYLEEKGFSKNDREDILLSVGEACTNSIRHAYSGENGREISVTVEDSGQEVTFKIRDFGKKIDLSKIKMPELPPEKPHGLGIYFMRTKMDYLEYNTAHDLGNELILKKFKN